MEKKQPDSHDAPYVLPSSFEIKKKAEETERALQDRPEISLRFRIMLSFGFIFILLCGMAAAFLVFISVFNGKQSFLEKIATYTAEIQQVRRYENSFFLNGTNLNNTRISVIKAHHVLRHNRLDMESIIGTDQFESMEKDLRFYVKYLNQLLTLDADPQNQNKTDRTRLETQIKKYGGEIQVTALSIRDQEKTRMQRLMTTAKIAIFIFLALFLISIVYINSILSRQLIQPINRAIKYTQRIARGDFFLVQPARKYRDEFSILAMALNRMILEIQLNQEQLTQSRKMAAIGNLTAGIAHELNNPLNNISLTTEALLEDLNDLTGDEKLSMLNDIFNQVERASTTVRNLLDFTRKEQSTFSALVITDIINSTVKLLNNEITLNQIELTLNIKKNLPPVAGSLQNLQQVFVNLIHNAIQAMPEGGTLGINTVLNDANQVRIDVVDSGIGIAENNLDKIFEPFFTTKEVGKGTGLGLSVAYGIIENHQGKITVKSEIGKGTTFSVFLPCQAGD